jgi:hypothetical protein
MTDREEKILALAKMRALGCLPTPTFPDSVSSLKNIASAAGRRLIELNMIDGNSYFSLGWVHGFEPTEGADTGISRSNASPHMSLVLAAALRECWTTAEQHPYPGLAVDEQVIMAAMNSLHNQHEDDTGGKSTSTLNHKTALRRLISANYLERDGSLIRLGPLVAAWSSNQVSILREHYNQFPHARRLIQN